MSHIDIHPPLARFCIAKKEVSDRLFLTDWYDVFLLTNQIERFEDCVDFLEVTGIGFQRGVAGEV